MCLRCSCIGYNWVHGCMGPRLMFWLSCSRLYGTLAILMCAVILQQHPLAGMNS
jgi:hypothetical protein